ncbi:MAG: carboxymuconolactone decarboxylase family protein [Tannerellaceae bacterium]|nr:carboxymuconolactone decarboxylase family protein [Tannerellaceae bacterium]
MKEINILVIAVITAILSIHNHPLKAQEMQNSLNPMQQKIVTIAANTAIGNIGILKTEINAGLDAGLTVNQVKEILIQMYAYAGFPRSLNGINTLMSVLDDRKAQGINDPEGAGTSPITDTRDKYTRGREVLENLTQAEQRTLTGVNAFAPAIDTFLKEHLFADIFERDVLTYSERELATISALAAMPGVDPMLQSHMNMGLHTGLTESQLREVVSIIGTSVNRQQGNNALQILDKVIGQSTPGAQTNESGISENLLPPGNNKVRLSLITVDSERLDEYNAFLKEEIEASMRLEPDVLTLYAVSEKENPNKVVILEIYADEAAYRQHIQTPHFIKYKEGTLDMVQSLELIDTTPLIPGLKIK